MTLHTQALPREGKMTTNNDEVFGPSPSHLPQNAFELFVNVYYLETSKTVQMDLNFFFKF